MQVSDIKSKFKEVYNGKPNIITPNVLRYGKKGDFLYELSAGDSMVPGQKIYGVTVISEQGERKHDLSKSFNSKPNAEEYISSLTWL